MLGWRIAAVVIGIPLAILGSDMAADAMSGGDVLNGLMVSLVGMAGIVFGIGYSD